MAKLEAKIAESGSSGKLETKLQKAKDNVTSINEIIGDLNSSSSELNLMGSKEVTQKFTFIELGVGTEVGYAEKVNDVITMGITSDANGFHEAVHGYQIHQTGGIRQSERLNVEVPAYQRQFSFDSSSVTGLSSDWGGIRGRSDISRNWVMGIRTIDGSYPYMRGFNSKEMKVLLNKLRNK
ncbi:hypothetical protein FAZ15_21955 [Sphingobacterium olei]|uniref:Uncharacterized protein n=1 Tax=Sphingobacterium olei TaxID=2571155 RepID=A0A4U0N828_9SPHI|nr:hypothetical protein [Sphingobacterium olei]TJZ49890.1 hypothetical protein FAZ15_21955 [Sphingobacterium olei]